MALLSHALNAEAVGPAGPAPAAPVAGATDVHVPSALAEGAAAAGESVKAGFDTFGSGLAALAHAEGMPGVARPEAGARVEGAPSTEEEKRLPSGARDVMKGEGGGSAGFLPDPTTIAVAVAAVRGKRELVNRPRGNLGAM